MQKVFDEVYTLDKRCYDEFLLNEDILMENAALGLAKVVRKKFKKGSSLLIVSGPGNNGADGITLARILCKEYEIYLYLPLGAKSEMCKIQLQRAKAVGVKEVMETTKADLVVDALFGSGLNKPLNEEATKVIEKLNTLKAFKIACDIPTGLDTKGNPSPVAFEADITVSMGSYKTPLFNDNAKDFVGKIKVADLGVNREVYESDTETYLLEKSDMRLPLRVKKCSNKGDFGHTLMILGEKKGACIIAAKAAFAFGSGLCSVFSKKPVKLPDEIMLTKCLPNNTTSVCLGMGLGKKYDPKIVEEIINDKKIPLVIDADLFKDELINKIVQQRENLILTPHPREFASLLKLLEIEDIDAKEVQKRRFELARDFTKRYKNVVLLLKGSNTLISQNGKVYINTFGLPTLSKGGSGDVLTGLIGALLSQGYETLDAAVSASLAHSFAAKAYKKANYSLSPNDLIEEIKCL